LLINATTGKKTDQIVDPSFGLVTLAWSHIAGPLLKM